MFQSDGEGDVKMDLVQEICRWINVPTFPYDEIRIIAERKGSGIVEGFLCKVVEPFRSFNWEVLEVEMPHLCIERS